MLAKKIMSCIVCVYDQVSGKVDITTPITGYENMGASLQQSGDHRDLSMTLTGYLNNKNVQVTGAFANKQRKVNIF